MSTEINMEYTNITLDKKIYTVPLWFLFFKPLNKSAYKEVANKAESNGFLVTEGMGIFEKSSFIGKGFAGIEVVEGDFKGEDSSDLFHLQGDFMFCEYKGSFRNLKSVYKKIMKDNPKCREFYAFYADDPEVVEESELRTRIIFR